MSNIKVTTESIEKMIEIDETGNVDLTEVYMKILNSNSHLYVIIGNPENGRDNLPDSKILKTYSKNIDSYRRNN